ncbi:hypothetical protein [Polaromonas sp. YR568]|uniref:hypothetical protein n=1 Tax=Polaromonas sp. YR568 TaxID=1855301 RepID=UPI00398C1F75
MITNWRAIASPSMTTTHVISEYRTSWYGRFGYLTMAVAGSFMFAMVALPFLLDPPAPQQPLPWSIKLISGPVLGLSGYIVFLCLRRIFGSSRRITTYPRGFIYKGPFGVVRTEWADIDSYWLGYGGNSPFLFLHIRLKDGSGNRRRKFKLDVSGLNPGIEQLMSEFLRQTGIKPKTSTSY